jgi:protein SCO1/2
LKVKARVMRWTMQGAAARAATVWIAAAMVVGFGSVRAAADNSRHGADYFTNVTLTTQDGAPVRFYDDVLKGKIVAIDLIYTTCKYACPLETARLAQVARLLGDRMGRDIFFYSITIDPDHDTPAVLKEYAEKYQAGPGWTFLTGKKDEIETISKKLGLYSEPDPRNPDGHQPFLLIGNEATGQWMRNSAVDNPSFMARTIGDWLTSWQKTKTGTLQSYTDVPTRLTLDQGQYTFANHCAACHTIGGGERLGPDLLGVSTTRDHDWLTRFIVAPDAVRAAGDPIALALRAKYKQVLMPRLDLGPEDAAMLIDYIDRQSRAVRDAAGPAATTAPATSRAAATTAPANLKPIVDPYLRIQLALNADRLGDSRNDARGIAAEAGKLGAGGAAIDEAAGEFQKAADLQSARTAFARLGDAIRAYAKETGAGIGNDVNVAYCPMLQKYWLQTGTTIRNPYYGQVMSDCGRIDAKTPQPSK